MKEYSELPMGFGMALLQDPQALRCFEGCSAEQRAEILESLHGVSSKSEMQELVRKLPDNYPV